MDQKVLEIAGKEAEIDPSDLEVADGEVVAKGCEPQKKISVSDVAAAATWTYGELITGTVPGFLTNSSSVVRARFSCEYGSGR